MVKGIFKTYNPAGTFLLPLSICYHHFTEHGDIAYVAYTVIHHMDTILVVLLVFLNLTKVTLLSEDWCMHIHIVL